MACLELIKAAPIRCDYQLMPFFKHRCTLLEDTQQYLICVMFKGKQQSHISLPPRSFIIHLIEDTYHCSAREEYEARNVFDSVQSSNVCHIIKLISDIMLQESDSCSLAVGLEGGTSLR